MKLHSIIWLAIAAAPALGAATITDVTGQTTALLETGDRLTFEIFDGSFTANASAFGLPLDPTDVHFAFVSAPTTWIGTFSGALGSADGAVSVAFGGPLSFRDGSVSGTGYQGAVDILQGFLHLSPLLSQEIFHGGSAMLTLRNDGPALTVGLGPYTLRHDLYVSLAGGGLSVGATGGRVSLETQSPGPLSPGPLSLGPLSLESLSPAPEPESGGLLLGGGALLCGLSVGLTRWRRGSGAPPK